MSFELDLLGVLDRGAALSPLERALLLARAGGAREPETLAVGERDRAVLALRSAVLGGDLEGTDRCPACGEVAEFTMAVAEFAAVGVQGGPVAVEADGYHVVCRAPTSADLRLALGGVSTGAGRALFAAVVESATRGDEPVGVDELSDGVVDAVGQALSACDPLADVQVGLSCEGCGAEWSSTLDLAEFTWRELRQWSRRVLWEVHTLARAYGWSESEVLAVPPSRRRAYLEWVSNG